MDKLKLAVIKLVQVDKSKGLAWLSFALGGGSVPKEIALEIVLHLSEIALALKEQDEQTAR